MWISIYIFLSPNYFKIILPKVVEKTVSQADGPPPCRSGATAPRRRAWCVLLAVVFSRTAVQFPPAGNCPLLLGRKILQSDSGTNLFRPPKASLKHHRQQDTSEAESERSRHAGATDSVFLKQPPAELFLH